ncbi:MAG: acetoin utilization deacetylase AcuC-like enzyme [Parasphingorhabdus sp.]|jgi:acetoin utilization deacetylase AcuC-like enzyme|uniref:histone deacetylase family protein n=1 Tax=Parasphingorhabdus sp. TaxID=2709688 RepID=UPI0039E53E61
MLHIVHHSDYVAPRPKNGSFVFDKYQLVMDAIRDHASEHVAHEPAPMPRQWIEAVHDADYVEQVLSAAVPRDKERRIGFPVSAEIASRVQYTSGGTWLAAQLALEHGYAANSAGGSHHAMADTGAGYCVFNDLAITANRLLAERDVRKILIVDLDVHQGDGTAMLLAGRTDVFTLSIHSERNFPTRKARSSRDIALPDAVGDDDYLSILDMALKEILPSFLPDMLLYQAGVDPHADDRLGRLALSDAGLERRDRMVIRQARDRGIAVASALGGGYGLDHRAVALRHARSMIAMADEADRGGAIR